MSDHSFAAILTGDIVASRRASAHALDRTMDLLAACAQDFQQDFARVSGQESGCAVHFARYRGDGWQIALEQGRFALRAALRLIATLRWAEALETRLAIGLGPIALPDTGNLASGHGPAFNSAGDILESLGKTERLSIGNQLGPPMRGGVGLLDWQSQNWTAPQGEALKEALRLNAPTQHQIAQRFGVSRQAVQSRLAGAGFSQIAEACQIFEDVSQDEWNRLA